MSFRLSRFVPEGCVYLPTLLWDLQSLDVLSSPEDGLRVDSHLGDPLQI